MSNNLVDIINTKIEGKSQEKNIFKLNNLKKCVTPLNLLQDLKIVT